MKQEKKVIALINFRDKDNFEKEYLKGEDISYFDDERVEAMVKKGHAEIQEIKEEKPKASKK